MSFFFFTIGSKGIKAWVDFLLYIHVDAVTMSYNLLAYNVAIYTHYRLFPSAKDGIYNNYICSAASSI